MARPLQKLQRFFRELRRRNVYKVAATYVVVAFIGLQAVDLLIPATTLPSWANELLLALLIMGFPVALVLAWALEMTPEGVRRTPGAAPEGRTGAATWEAEGEPDEATQLPAGGSRTGWRVLVGLGLVAAAVAGGWFLTGGGGESSPESAAAGDSAGGGARSVAVLPFTALSEGEDSETFARGIHDDLLTRLAHISGLKVISRRAVERYRDTELTTSQIADSLDVRWVMEGGVQVLGEQIRVNAQLINPRTEATAWAEGYRRSLTAEDLFALQSEITQRIAGSLEARLSPAERARVERRPTENLEAYRLYVRARSLLDQRTEPEMRQAARAFTRAIRRDSSYALSWAGLADALTLLADYGYAGRDTLLPEARRAARRALELDPMSAEAHASLGLIELDGRRSGPSALRELQRAVELRPSYAEAHNWMSWLYSLLGMPERALASGRRAVRLDPLSPEALSNLGLSYLAMGARDSALQVLDRAVDLQPDYPSPALYKATTLYHMGRMEEARSDLRGTAVPWARSAPLATLALIDVDRGMAQAAKEKLTRLMMEAETPFYAGLVHAALDRPEEALSAFEQVDDWTAWPRMAWPILSLRYLYPTVLGPLRDTPRYRTLTRDLNRSWGLNPDGSLPDSVDVSFESESDE